MINPRINRRRFLIDSRNVLATSVVAGTIGSGASYAQKKAPVVIRAVMNTGLRTTDPILTNAYITRNHAYMIYDTLFGIDDKFDVKPQMVDTYTVSPDQLTYTFTLREHLLFHDGQPVRAEDCIASLRRWGKRDTMGQKLMQFTADLVSVNDNTFKLILKEPYGLVLQSLGKPSSLVPFIMPKRLAETPADKAVSEEIGSGPFRFVTAEFQPGQKAVYEKNLDYVPRQEPCVWLSGGKVVNVDRVEWVAVPDAQTAVNALIQNEVDFIENAPYDLLPTLTAARGVKVQDLMQYGYCGNAQLNWLQPPFNNQKIRQAALAAIYQQDYLDAQIGNANYEKVCGAMFVCGTRLSTDIGATQVQKPDLDRARQLLKEGNYDGSPVLIMQATDVPLLSPLALVSAQALQAIGMKVQVASMDLQTMFARRANQGPISQGGWSLYHGNWQNIDMANPINNAGVNARGKNGGFFGWAEDAEIEKLRDDYARTADMSKQKELATAIQKRAYEVVTYIPTGEFKSPYAFRESLSNLASGPGPVFWSVRKT